MKRAWVRDVLFGLLGALTVLGGVLLADSAFDDAVIVLPEPEVAFAVPRSEATTPDDPGALSAPVAVAVPSPLFEAADAFHPIIYDEAGVPVPDGPGSGSQGPGAGGGGPGDSGSPGAGSPTATAPTASGDGSAGGAAPPPVGFGSASAAEAGTQMVTIVRFLDLCTEKPAGGCPLGVPATVLFGGGGSAPSPLQIEILPEATLAMFPRLRCDPGRPTETVIPVALLSNRPLTQFDGTLRTGDGSTLLDDIAGRRSSPPSEFDIYEYKVKVGIPTAATIEGGFHTCLQVEIDRNAQVPAAHVTAPDRNSEFEIFIRAFADKHSQTKTVKFTGQFNASSGSTLYRPINLWPLNAERALLLVPQRPDETTVVWLRQIDASLPPSFAGQSGCLGLSPQADGMVAKRDPMSAAKPFSPKDLNAPDYPWNRAQSHYTIWDLDLSNASAYALCVSWSSGKPTEEWELRTPDGYELQVKSYRLKYSQSRTKGTMLVNIYGASGCFVANPHAVHRPEAPFPDIDLIGTGVTGTYGDMCSTAGYLGPQIELEASFPDGSNVVYGRVTIPKNLLLTECVSLWAASGSPCDTTLTWSNPNVLCGGGLFEPKCSPVSAWFALDVSFRLVPRYAKPVNRPDWRDWGFNRVHPAT